MLIRLSPVLQPGQKFQNSLSTGFNHVYWKAFLLNNHFLFTNLLFKKMWSSLSLRHIKKAYISFFRFPLPSYYSDSFNITGVTHLFFSGPTTWSLDSLRDVFINRTPCTEDEILWTLQKNLPFSKTV